MGSTLLTAAILLGIPCLFMFLFSQSHKRSKNKDRALRMLRLDALVAAQGLTLSNSEEISQQLLAIDTQKGMFMYISHKGAENDTLLADLSQIKMVKVSVIDYNIYDERNGKMVSVGTQVSKVLLELSAKDPRLNNEIIFYDATSNGIDELSTLKRSANYWEEQIAKHLKNGKLSAVSPVPEKRA